MLAAVMSCRISWTVDVARTCPTCRILFQWFSVANLIMNIPPMLQEHDVVPYHIISNIDKYRIQTWNANLGVDWISEGSLVYQAFFNQENSARWSDRWMHRPTNDSTNQQLKPKTIKSTNLNPQFKKSGIIFQYDLLQSIPTPRATRARPMLDLPEVTIRS